MGLFDPFPKHQKAVIVDGFLWGAMEHGNQKYENHGKETQLKVVEMILTHTEGEFGTTWRGLFEPILEGCKNSEFVLSNTGSKSIVPKFSEKSIIDFFKHQSRIKDAYGDERGGWGLIQELQNLALGLLGYCDGFFYMKESIWDPNNPQLGDYNFLKEYVSQLKNIEHSFDQYRSILETILRISTNEVIAQGINMVNKNNVRAYNDEFLQNLQDYIHAQIDEHESKASDQRKRIKKITKNLSKDDGIRNFIQEMSA